MYYTYTEDYIAAFYRRMNIYQPEQLDYIAIAESLNISIFYWDSPSSALFSSHFNYIILKEHEQKELLWEDFCHELAHVLFHTGKQFNLTPAWISYQEQKANYFMYHAAVPTFMLDQQSFWSVDKVAATFNVSNEFATKRLEDYVRNKQFR